MGNFQITRKRINHLFYLERKYDKFLSLFWEKLEFPGNNGWGRRLPLLCFLYYFLWGKINRRNKILLYTSVIVFVAWLPPSLLYYILHFLLLFIHSLLFFCFPDKEKERKLWLEMFFFIFSLFFFSTFCMFFSQHFPV